MGRGCKKSTIFDMHRRISQTVRNMVAVILLLWTNRKSYYGLFIGDKIDDHELKRPITTISRSIENVVGLRNKLFNLFMINGCVPMNFGKSYTVPIPTRNATRQALTADNFRGIFISPTISKLFEHAVLVRFSRYFGNFWISVWILKQLSLLCETYHWALR